MKQNKYDDPTFYKAYEQMPRSVKGLEGAGEWHEFQALLPDFRDATVLDLGCGFGWHCRYARERQASSVVGVDISENMLRKARELTDDPAITYMQGAIEDIRFPDGQFDIVISSLALHYVERYDAVCETVHRSLKAGGTFLFSVEHPMFTARSEQDWWHDRDGNRLHWPVDHYQAEGIRETSFLSADVIKYHRTFSTYMNTLVDAGFRISAVREPVPSEPMLRTIPDMIDETRRPMFMIIKAEKPAPKQTPAPRASSSSSSCAP